MASLRSRWIAVRESFWLVPSAVVAGLGLLALTLIRVDRSLELDSELEVVFGGDASAAREILSAAAGSIATVGGVTLSLAVVTFQLVAGQYSPRAVRTLVQDRMIQLTAGAFVGVVAFCLLVLRVVRDANGGDEFVPRLSVTTAIVLTLGALMLLIVFVHHLAGTIRVENIAADVARHTLAALNDLYPERLGTDALLEVCREGLGSVDHDASAEAPLVGEKQAMPVVEREAHAQVGRAGPVVLRRDPQQVAGHAQVHDEVAA